MLQPFGADVPEHGLDLAINGLQDVSPQALRELPIDVQSKHEGSRADEELGTAGETNLVINGGW